MKKMLAALLAVLTVLSCMAAVLAEAPENEAPVPEAPPIEAPVIESPSGGETPEAVPESPKPEEPKPEETAPAQTPDDAPATPATKPEEAVPQPTVPPATAPSPAASSSLSPDHHTDDRNTAPASEPTELGLEVRVVGSDTVFIGESARIELVITNRTEDESPLMNIVVKANNKPIFELGQETILFPGESITVTDTVVLLQKDKASKGVTVDYSASSDREDGSPLNSWNVSQSIFLADTAMPKALPVLTDLSVLRVRSSTLLLTATLSNLGTDDFLLDSFCAGFASGGRAVLPPKGSNALGNGAEEDSSLTLAPGGQCFLQYELEDSCIAGDALTCWVEGTAVRKNSPGPVAVSGKQTVAIPAANTAGSTNSLSVALTVNSRPKDAAGYNPGEKIKYTITVESSENVDEAEILDSLHGGEPLPGVTHKGKGKPWEVSCTYTVTEEDARSGLVLLRAYARGVNLQTMESIAGQSAVIPLPVQASQNSGLILSRELIRSGSKPGDSVTCQITVINAAPEAKTAKAQLSDVHVYDCGRKLFDDSITLEAGERRIFFSTYEIGERDAEAGWISGSAAAYAKTADGTYVTAVTQEACLPLRTLSAGTLRAELAVLSEPMNKAFYTPGEKVWLGVHIRNITDLDQLVTLQDSFVSQYPLTSITVPADGEALYTYCYEVSRLDSGNGRVIAQVQISTEDGLCVSTNSLVLSTAGRSGQPVVFLAKPEDTLHKVGDTVEYTVIVCGSDAEPASVAVYSAGETFTLDKRFRFRYKVTEEDRQRGYVNFTAVLSTPGTGAVCSNEDTVYVENPAPSFAQDFVPLADGAFCTVEPGITLCGAHWGDAKEALAAMLESARNNVGSSRANALLIAEHSQAVAVADAVEAMLGATGADAADELDAMLQWMCAEQCFHLHAQPVSHIDDASEQLLRNRTELNAVYNSLYRRFNTPEQAKAIAASAAAFNRWSASRGDLLQLIYDNEETVSTILAQATRAHCDMLNRIFWNDPFLF